MPVVTARLIIVATAASRDLVNNTIKFVDPASVGDVLVAPLSIPGNTSPDAYWCSWATDDATTSGIQQAIRNAGWSPRPTPSELKLYQPGDNVPAFGSQRVWVFNGLVWSPQDVLANLGLTEFIVGVE